MKLTINTNQVITKIINITVKFNFNIEDFIEEYKDSINNEDDLWKYIMEFINNSQKYSNKVFDAVGGDSVEEYFNDNSDDFLNIIEEEELFEKLKHLIKNYSCCDGYLELGYIHCPKCGKNYYL